MAAIPGAPKQSNKPTGKGSRGPYKKTLQKQQAAALGRNVGSLSPIASTSKSKSKSSTPKPYGPSTGGKKRKKGQDDDGLMSRGSSRAASLVGGSSRGGTPDDGDDLDEDDLDLDEDEDPTTRRGRRRGGGESGSEEEEEEEEEEEDQGEDGDHLFEVGVVRKRLKAAKEGQMLLVDHLDHAQRSRFDAWKTSSFSKPQMKKFIVQHTGNSISDELAQIVGGVSKIFVGLIVSKARAIQQSRNESGPLTPAHLREAHRQYVQESGKGYGLQGSRPGADGLAGKKKKGLFVQ